LGFKGIVSWEEDIFMKACSLNQGFVSGSGLDPNSIRSVDPDPYSESGSGSGRANMNHKSTKIKKFHAGCSFLRAEGFFVTWTSFMEA
jgi:hypothetical protein